MSALMLVDVFVFVGPHNITTSLCHNDESLTRTNNRPIFHSISPNQLSVKKKMTVLSDALALDYY